MPLHHLLTSGDRPLKLLRCLWRSATQVVTRDNSMLRLFHAAQDHVQQLKLKPHCPTQASLRSTTAGMGLTSATNCPRGAGQQGHLQEREAAAGLPCLVCISPESKGMVQALGEKRREFFMGFGQRHTLNCSWDWNQKARWPSPRGKTWMRRPQIPLLELSLRGRTIVTRLPQDAFFPEF